MYRDSDSRTARRPWTRIARLADSYTNLTGPNNQRWEDVPQDNGLYNIPSSRFLRQYSPQASGLDGLRLQRILGSMRNAAQTQSIFHIWWHPHNFGVNTKENLAILRRILESFTRLRTDLGMQSMSMWEVATAMGARPVREAIEIP
jgi:hypothetical protein